MNEKISILFYLFFYLLNLIITIKSKYKVFINILFVQYLRCKILRIYNEFKNEFIKEQSMKPKIIITKISLI